MDEGKRAVPYSKGQALADEFGIQFFETSAKSNVNVDEVRGCAGRASLPVYSGASLAATAQARTGCQAAQQCAADAAHGGSTRVGRWCPSNQRQAPAWQHQLRC